MNNKAFEVRLKNFETIGVRQHLHEYLIIALARSGYHAITHWLCCRMPGNVIFLNNCNPQLKFRNISVYENSRAPHTFKVYSFENFDLRGLRALGLQDRFEEIIIINRDPFNWIASSLKKGHKCGLLDIPFKCNPKVIRYSKYTCQTLSRVDMFVQYMEQCLGEKNFIGRDFHHINYNKWFADEEYRKEICNWFQFVYVDGDMNYVPFRGGGSSFDKFKYHGRGSEMDVLNRWEEYKDDERYLELLTPEIREYSRKYFNFEPI